MGLRSLFPRTPIHRPGLDSVTLLAAVLLVIQIVVTALGGAYEWRGGEEVPRREFLQFALSLGSLLEGRGWTLATHALLHGGWFHFLLNWLVIYLVGGRVFHILGGRAFGAICGLGVLGGAVLHVLTPPDTPLVGASAAGMALLVAMTGLSPDSRMWPLPVTGKNLGRGILLASLLLGLLDPRLGVPGLRLVGAYAMDHGLAALFQVGHLYHFGGGLAGWFYVRRLMRRPVTLEELREERARRESARA